ncbi:hypothetical protein TSUD_146470, partial [Trifolium subterraneum]
MVHTKQFYVINGLCEWRDIVARSEDESTGYVLPNKSVLEIAKHMPVTTSKLRRLVKSKHPYLEHNLDSVVNVIRHSIQNAAAFEVVAQQLKEGQSTTASDAIPVTDQTEDPVLQTHSPKESFQHQDTDIKIKLKPNNVTSEIPRESLTISEQTRDPNVGALSTLKGNEATVQVLKKPVGAFGALLGNTSKRKLGLDKKGKEEIKLEKIRSSVTLPFHSFLGSSDKAKSVVETPSVASDQQKPVSDPVSTSPLDEIIMLETDTGAEEDAEQNNNLENSNEHREKNSSASTSDEDEPTSLSELSSNFQKCFQSNKQNNKTGKPKKTEQASGLLQLTPFDYEAAMNHVKFGEKKKDPSSQNCDGRAEKKDSGGKKRSTIGEGQP